MKRRKTVWRPNTSRVEPKVKDRRNKSRAENDMLDMLICSAIKKDARKILDDVRWCSKSFILICPAYAINDCDHGSKDEIVNRYREEGQFFQRD